MPLLELREITKDFPGVRALDGVSFDLEAGEVHALCGENGAGKSTLIKVLSGFYPAGTYGGEIVLDGKPVAFKSIHEAEEHGIALIAQELALVPELSVAENISLGREPVKAGLIRWEQVNADARRAHRPGSSRSGRGGGATRRGTGSRRPTSREIARVPDG